MIKKRFLSSILTIMVAVVLTMGLFSVSVFAEKKTDATETTEEVAEEVAEEATEETSAGNSNAITPEGNLTLVDNIIDEESGKQFITVVTKSGNYFYIIIDQDDDGEGTVYFLNLVDEYDLLTLLDEDDAEEYLASVEKVAATNEEETTAGASETIEAATGTDDTATGETEETGGFFYNSWAYMVLVVVIIAVMVFLFVKKRFGKSKGEKSAEIDVDDDYVNEIDDDEIILPEASDTPDYDDVDDYEQD